MMRKVRSNRGPRNHGARALAEELVERVAAAGGNAGEDRQRAVHGRLVVLRSVHRLGPKDRIELFDRKIQNVASKL